MTALTALPSLTFAATNSGITYQGRILKPDGSPLAGATVQFKLQIRSPDANNCLMFEEQQTLDMRNSNGVFALTLNDGTGTRTDASGYSLDRVFSNAIGTGNVFAFNPATCITGSTYATGTGDGRNLVVLFKDETMAAYEPMPAQKINFAPFAFEAKQIAGFTPASLVRVAESDGTLDTVSPLSNANYTELLALIGGTSAQYTKQSATAGSVVTTVGGTGNVASPAAGSVWLDTVAGNLKFYDGSVVKTVGTAGGSVTSVATGAGLTGGPITTTGTIALATVGSGGTGFKVTYDTYGRVTAAVALVEADIPTLSTAGHVIGSAITSGTIGGTTAINTSGTISSGSITSSGLITSPSLSSTAIGTQSVQVFETTNSFKVTLQAPASLGANYAITLPTAAGSSGQFLTTNGSGVTSWSTGLTAATAFVNGGNTFGAVSNIGNNDNFDLNVKTNNLPRMTVAAAGNVGIGTTAPGNKLDVNGGVNVSGILNANGGVLSAGYSNTTYASGSASPWPLGSNLITFNSAVGDNTGPFMVLRGTNTALTSQNGYFGAVTNTSGFAPTLVFGQQTAASTYTERMRIDGSGNVGIGTTAPSFPLEVNRSSPGTISSAATAVTGTGTTFTSTFKVGDSIYAYGQSRTVTAIANDTSLTTSAAFSPAPSSLSYTRAQAKINGTLELEGTGPSANGGGPVGQDLLVLRNTYTPEGWNTGSAIRFEGPSGKFAGRISTAYDGGGSNYDMLISTSANPNAMNLWFSGAVGFSSVSGGAGFDIGPTGWNAAGQTIGTRIKQSLPAAANSDALNAVVIDPTFTDGGFTGITHNGLIVKSGNVGIGTTAPSAILQLKAGTAAASTAPLKFTTGTLLTTPEDGALEYASSNLYYTIGATRYVVPMNASAGNFSNVSSINNSSGSITMSPMAGNSVIVNAATVSTSSTTGALVVSGGLGVAGAINSAGNIMSGGSVTATTNMVSPQIYGSTAAAGNIKIDGTSNASVGNVLLSTAGGNVGIGTTSPVARLDVTGNAIASAGWATSGASFNAGASTFTDATGTGGTVPSRVANSFGIPTMAATTATTLTTAANVYIAGPPAAGALTTMTTPLALQVGGGNSYFNGNIGIGNGSNIGAVGNNQLGIISNPWNHTLNYTTTRVGTIMNGSVNNTGTTIGLESQLDSSRTGTIGALSAISGAVTHFSSAGATTSINGGAFSINDNAASNTTTARGLSSAVNNTGSGTVATAQGLYAITTNTGTGTITNSYGVYIDTLAGTNRWGLYQNGANDNNYFAGNVGIGTTAPTDSLHVSGGGVSISTSFTSSNEPGLSVAALAGDTILTVATTAGYPTSGLVQVDSEVISFTGVTATTFTGLTRGLYGTSAAGHALAALVVPSLMTIKTSNERLFSISSTGAFLAGAGSRLTGVASNGTAIGRSNSVQGTDGAVIGGAFNVVGGNQNGRTIVGGSLNTNSGNGYATVVGGFYGNAGIYGESVHASGRFAATGDAQTAEILLRNSTTDATPTNLYADGTTASYIVSLPNNFTYVCDLNLGGRSSTGVAASFARKLTISRGANAAATVLNNLQTIGTDYNPSAWGGVTLSADTTNGGLNLAVVGAAATNIRWLALVKCIEIGY